MKKLTLLVSAVILVFVFASCGKTTTPKDVANDYYAALQKGDFEKALSYTDMTDSEEIQKYAGKMQSYALNISEYEIVKEEIAEDGNSATVEAKYTYTSEFNKNPEDNTQTLDLIKKDGKWVITME